MERTDCPQCGAAAKLSGARFCEYCGAELPRVLDELPHSPDERRTARLERLEAHPLFQGMLSAALDAASEVPRRTAPDPARVHRGPTRNTVILFGTISVVALLAMARGDLSESGFLALVLAGFGCVLIVAVRALRWPRSRPREVAARPTRRPVLPRAAAVVDERSEVSGHGSHGDVRTRYFLTLEFVNGARAEYGVDARLAAHCASGDVGAAFIERGSLSSFQRIKI